MRQPNSALVPDTHNRDYPMYDWPTRHRTLVEYAAGRDADVVFIGDSISTETMPDYVHPTDVAYRAMAGAIRPHLENWMGVASGVPIELWPHQALTPIAETVDDNGYVRNVAVPQVIPFLPPAGKANGTAILICPGGAYCLLDWTAHVERLAERFNPEGIAVIGVRYRTSPPSTNVPGDALEDLRRAIRIVVANAARWRIYPDRLVGLGYSAGSNLLLTHACTEDNLLDKDALHRGVTRLRHMALLCLWPHDKPVSAYSIRPNPPSVFLCTTEEDSVAPAVFSQGIAAVLRKAGGDADVTTFPKGDHLAFNFREDGPEVDWTSAFLRWLKRKALLA